jgi:uncharacterized phage protein gp47/JayE
MITQINTVEKLKQLFLEILINKTNKVSDISDNSVLNAVAYGTAKVAQKCMKDIAIVESHIFPDSASGEYLDSSATLFGAIPRRTVATGSSTYLRLVGAIGTQYIAGTNNFSNYNGVQFELESDFTIGDFGWGYAKIRSIDSGSKTNVEPNSIVNVFPIPVGHIGCTNEYYAIGGSDIESDELLRIRIKKHLNILSKSTIAYLTEVFRSFNSDILNLINLGNDDAGNRVIAIVLQSGQGLNQPELDDLLDQVKSYFPITDLNMYGDTIGIKLQNVEWDFIDVDFRVQIMSDYDTDEVRKQIQINLTKYIDFRFWDSIRKVEWDDLLSIVKNTEGVRYVPDTFFNPFIDKKIPSSKLPRIRGFIMRNLDGVIVADSNNVISPIFYPIS